VWAVKDTIYAGTSDRQHTLHFFMHFLQIVLAVMSARNARMVGGNNNQITGLLQAINRFNTTRNRIPAFYCGDVFLLPMVNYPIPFKDYHFGQ
jgi:hypothetical protein